MRGQPPCLTQGLRLTTAPSGEDGRGLFIVNTYQGKNEALNVRKIMSGREVARSDSEDARFNLGIWATSFGWRVFILPYRASKIAISARARRLLLPPTAPIHQTSEALLKGIPLNKSTLAPGALPHRLTMSLGV